MAERHPYSPTPGGITAAIKQFRKSFPPVVKADTLRQLDIAPKNESYAINVLRFIGAIDKDGKPIEKAANVFYQSDAEFQKGFEDLIKTAYKDLFALHKDAVWTLPAEKLTAFFRNTDKTTALVGRLQATTFQVLAALAGHGTIQEPATPKKATASKAKPAKAKPDKSTGSGGQDLIEQNERNRDIGLTVRIEVNLPPAGDQETYDRIFRSIRENLLNAK